jgi:ribosomal protein S18 acetylase RimI-like enzyme
VSTVRRAEPKDAGPLAALAERTFRATFGSSNSRENMDAHCARSFGEAIQASEIVDPAIETFVCEDGAELAGYAQLRWGVAPPCVAAARPAEIQRIYVDRRWQGQGVAQALMDRLLDAATRGGADALWLGVWEHNPRAVAFYRKIGFEKVGHHVFRLGDDPQHDWILCRGVGGARPGA